MCNNFMSVQAALEKAEIVPSDDAVDTADFTQALTKAFGYAPILHCHNDHHSGDSYIDEVSRCHVKCRLEPQGVSTGWHQPSEFKCHRKYVRWAQQCMQIWCRLR